MSSEPIGVVVIGRNEGQRLERCLRSIPVGVPVLYVDSGSTDGSVALANSLGITVVSLDMQVAFTAARARNVGYHKLAESPSSDVEFIQFVDGDCELQPGWLDQALAAIRAEPALAAVFGRLRERFPERSVYNRMCDDEWNVPVGIAAWCGGNALFRLAALQTVDGFSGDMLAGEEPDLCLRLGHLGWLVRRVDGEMALHDANILGFASWWRRARRSGFAYAEHNLRHGTRSHPEWRKQLVSILFWGLGWPFIGVIVSLFFWFRNPAVSAVILTTIAVSYPLQILRIAAYKRNTRCTWAFALKYGALIMIGKFAELSGALRCGIGRSLYRPDRPFEFEKVS